MMSPFTTFKLVFCFIMEKRSVLFLGIFCIFCSQASLAAENQAEVISDAAVPIAVDEPVLEADHPRNELRVGDKIKMVFYESLGSTEDGWASQSGSPNSAPRSFYQRPELTGEYLVEADGTISLPMLGRFPVKGLLPRAVELSILHSYETLVAKKGFVTILGIEHQPIHITGPVRSPGAFAYVEGMTVLHAVSAAGGVTVKAIEPWQKVEIARQIERLKGELGDLKRIVSETQVLRAERDSVQVASIDPTVVSDPDAKKRLDDEELRRRLVMVGQDAQHEALIKVVASAQAELELRQARVGIHDETIRVRRDRLTRIGNLAKNQLIGTIEYSRAQSDLTDAEDRKQQAVIDVETVKQRLAVAKQDVQRDIVERNIEVKKSTAESERNLTAALQTTEGDLQIFRAMVSTNESSNMEFTIVRSTENGVVVEPATEETVLQPGDLVRLR